MQDRSVSFPGEGLLPRAPEWQNLEESSGAEEGTYCLSTADSQKRGAEHWGQAGRGELTDAQGASLEIVLSTQGALRRAELMLREPNTSSIKAKNFTREMLVVPF